MSKPRRDIDHNCQQVQCNDGLVVESVGGGGVLAYKSVGDGGGDHVNLDDHVDHRKVANGLVDLSLQGEKTFQIR